MKLAVEHRTSANPSGLSDLWLSRVRGRHLVISAGHEDYPALVAEALDRLHETGWQVSAAARMLGVSPSQLIRLFKKAPAAWARVNEHRLAIGLPALK